MQLSKNIVITAEDREYARYFEQPQDDELKLFNVKIDQPKNLSTGRYMTYTPRQLLDMRFFQGEYITEGEELLHPREKSARTQYKKLYKNFLKGSRNPIPNLEIETMLRSVLLTIELAHARRKVLKSLHETLTHPQVQDTLAMLEYQGEIDNTCDLMMALRAIETMTCSDICAEQKIKAYVEAKDRRESYRQYAAVLEQRRQHIILTAVARSKGNDYFATSGCSAVSTELLENLATTNRLADARGTGNAKKRSRENNQSQRNNKRQKFGNNGNNNGGSRKNGNNNQNGRGKGKGKGRGRGRGRNSNGRNANNSNSQSTTPKEEPTGSS